MKHGIAQDRETARGLQERLKKNNSTNTQHLNTHPQSMAEGRKENKLSLTVIRDRYCLNKSSARDLINKTS